MTLLKSSGFTERMVRNSLDGSNEPYLLWLPPGEPEALLVGLHQWGSDRFTQQQNLLPYCQSRNWALLLPEFRGPNIATNPRATEAGGSALARRDIIDAVQDAVAFAFQKIPPTFLLGGSGGGHMALLTAARESFVWTGVSSWCPITDLRLWTEQNQNYDPHVAAVCGGSFGTSETIDREYHLRSPIHFAEALSRIRLQLGHGRHDQVVSYLHGWNLARAIEAHQPEAFYFSLFEGGHVILHEDAFRFFEQSLKNAGETAAQIGG